MSSKVSQQSYRKLIPSNTNLAMMRHMLRYLLFLSIGTLTLATYIGSPEVFDDYTDDVSVEMNKLTDPVEGMLAASLQTSTIGTFLPLDCNSELHTADCSVNKISSIYSSGNELEIPCGECWEWDVTGDVTVSGIDVKGKLVFPPSVAVSIFTPYIIVEGELAADVDRSLKISPENIGVRFIFTGTDDVLFSPTDSPNEDACSQQQGGKCNFGAKAFVVVGGKLNIQGISSSCNTWTPIKDKHLKKPEKNPDDYRLFSALPESCPVTGLVYIQDDFEGGAGNWICTSCSLGYDTNEKAIVAYDRPLYYRGPLLDYSDLQPESCLTVGQQYLFSARIKLKNSTDLSDADVPTTCKSSNSFCPRVYSQIKDNVNGVTYTRRLSSLLQVHAGNYGEYVYFRTSFTYTEEELSVEDAAYKIYIDGPEPDVDIIIADFAITLPSETSYPVESDVCKDLIFNGDAEGNGFHPYPFTTSLNSEKLVIKEENGNKYYSLTSRSQYYSSVKQSVDVSCLDRGVTYFATFDVRIHSNAKQSYRIHINAKGLDGYWKSRRIVECPAQSILDGFVTCQGTFVIDSVMPEYEPGTAYLRFEMSNTRDGGTFDIDFDNMKIEYYKGYVSRLVVDSNDVSCWGSGADIHVTSSTLYNWASERQNGYEGTIDRVAVRGGGISYIYLDLPPIEPIITEADDEVSAAVVALLSRNIRIEDDASEEKKGAYLQILHTSTTQIVEGVEFSKSGRRAERDRHTVQFAYCNNVEGSSISRNSFREGNNRCVVVGGTSNVTVSDNVAHKSNGHCILIGDLSESNVIHQNLISQNNRHWPVITADIDHHPAAVWSEYPPNSYSNNMVVASRYWGFHFANKHYVINEDGSRDYSIEPRTLQLQKFEGNVGNSNGFNGMYFSSFRQQDPIYLKGIRTLKNRFEGLRLHYTYHVRVSDSVFADNGLSLDVKWSADMVIQDSTVIGISNLTRSVVAQPYYSKRCVTDNFQAPIGYKMPTAIDGSFAAKANHQGVFLKNVNFAGFNNDECVGDVSILLDSVEFRDGHWDYVSAFDNVKFDSMPFISAEAASAVGIQTVAITDVGGKIEFPTYTPAGTASTSSIVSSNPIMKAFADAGSCVDYPGKVSYCKGLCLRQLSIFVDQTETAGWSMSVQRDSDGLENTIGSIYQYDNEVDVDSKYRDINKRKFAVSIPYGNFTVKFNNANGEVSWPRFAYQSWEGIPTCDLYPIGANVKLPLPPGEECDGNLVDNGRMEEDMEGVLTPWVTTGGRIELIRGGGVDGSDALLSLDRTSKYNGPGQNLDTRCFTEEKEVYYEVKAWFRMEVDGDSVACDPYAWPNTLCPRASLQFKSYEDEIIKDTMVDVYRRGNVAKVQFPYSSSEFSLIHGVVKSGPDFWNAEQAFLFFDYSDQNMDIVLDDVSMEVLERFCDRELVINGNLDTGYSIYWTLHGSRFEMLNLDGNYALKVTHRNSWRDGVRFYLTHLNKCLQEQPSMERYVVSGKFKLENKETGVISNCDRYGGGTLACSLINIKSDPSTEGGGVFTYQDVAVTVAAHESVTDGWDIMSGVYVVDENHRLNPSNIYLTLRGPHEINNVIYDDISVTPLEKNCESLVLNPNFNDGTAVFWRPGTSTTVTTEIVMLEESDGYDESSFALRMLHTHTGHTVTQELDTRCFVEGQEYKVEAKFQLLNATTDDDLDCDPNVQVHWDKNACPMIRLYGWNCDNGNEDYRFWNNLPFFEWDAMVLNPFLKEFTVSANLASCKNVKVELGYQVPTDRALIVDDVNIQLKSTFPPTPVPTYFPTQPKEKVPTLTPTSTTGHPSVVAMACPPSDAPLELEAGQPHMLFHADAGTLCTIRKISLTDENIIVSLARSYDTNPWEATASSFIKDEEIICYTQGCQINLPLVDDAKYVLSSFVHTTTEVEELARFLETATYGITRQDLTSIGSINGSTSSTPTADKIVSWVQTQMDESQTPVTSHRDYWRKRANPRQLKATAVGIPDHPCQIHSRWRRIAFTLPELHWTFIDDRPFKVVSDSGSGSGGPYILYLDSHPRTVVQSFVLEEDGMDTYVWDPNHEYTLCAGGVGDVGIGGKLLIRLEDGNCYTTRNPVIDFTGYENLLSFQLNFNSADVKPIDEWHTKGAEYILETDLEDAICDQIPPVVQIADEPVYGKVSDGTWLQFDPRLQIETNTLDQPLKDGGNAISVVSSKLTACSNAPRTFLNADQCQLKTNACTASSNGAILLDLDVTTMETLYELTGQYVYAVDGLPVVDEFNNQIPHPCTPGLRSRWIPTTTCNPSPLFSGTLETLRRLLRTSTDASSVVRDIYFPEKNGFCNETDTFPEIEIEVDDTCWKRVHPDHMSIFDFTYWTVHHPGGEYQITKWADELDSTTLIYPAVHDYAIHPMTRWDDNYHKFPYVGRLGDTILLQDLPTSLRTVEVLQHFSDTGGLDNTHTVVCGSPNEVENEPERGFIFDVGHVTVSHQPKENRGNIWTMIAMDAPDQLRQRVAWALAQMLVVVPGELNESAVRTEIFVTYYDILVKHAFGNFRNILKEISYNPLMAEHLSFLGSKSSAYLRERYNQKAQADENFAREIMQLFTIGILELNIDGTEKHDERGKSILTYSNDDIMSFSRAWTGFQLQTVRGNVEGWQWNRVDPMQIVAVYRDNFPKTAWDSYIGDGYPLCTDLPSKPFLRKGAQYRIIGSSEALQKVQYVQKYGKMTVSKMLVLDDDSELRTLLCNGDTVNCPYSNSIALANEVGCTGNECNVDTVNIVQVAPSLFYEYIPPACVQLTFYKSAKKLSQRVRTYATMCGNPQLPDASEACCSSGSPDATRHNLFDGEHMTYQTAKLRCVENSKQACDFAQVSGDRYKNAGFFWTTDDCLIQVKVKEDTGHVTVVYEPSSYTKKVLHVDDENENYFKVFWKDGDYPKKSTGCGGFCEEMYQDDSCLCNTATFSSRVFSRMPTSILEAKSKLSIGAFDPTDDNAYSSRFDDQSKITVHSKDEKEHDIHTIYEYVDDKGRHYFMKNIRHVVKLMGIGGGFTTYSFRNPVQFNSLVPSKESVHNAIYETEATLDKYFYHDNMAPFLAIRLIQRFGTSNPSPRYVRTVSEAFMSGTFGSFGSGEYGDMKATIAAVLLDREARNVVLDADPTHGSLREPLLKVIALMRSMEYKTEDPSTRVSFDAIGQAAYEFPSVFSFFLPEFTPTGRAGNAKLVSPEAQLLDMPKVVKLVNGMISTVSFGLGYCNSGLGRTSTSACRAYNRERGYLSYNIPDTTSPFAFETFEGPSLTGGNDVTWVGWQFRENNGEAVLDPNPDPNDLNNHVIHFTSTSAGSFFSPQFSTNDYGGTVVVKFRYYSPNTYAGGCIGYVDGDVDPTYINTGDWTFCDAPDTYALNMMSSNGAWINCQFEVPQNDQGTYRILIADRRGSSGDAYFDDIQIDQNNDGTTCSNVSVEKKNPPGQIGYSTEVVDELALLLTAGRLTDGSRKIVRDAYDAAAGSAEDALKVAQKLIVTSPEFHSTNLIVPKDELRDPYTFPEPSNKPYKAVVYIMFSGGCDSFNMLAPHTCTKGKDLYEEYLKVRQNVAIPKHQLLPIDASDQICEKFGIHHDLPVVQEMYNDGDLLFFANTGVMTRQVDKHNYSVLTKTQLFAHNHMQRETKRLDPNDVVGSTGFLGRIADALENSGSNVGLFSVDRFSEAVVGRPGGDSPPIIVSSHGGIPDIYIPDDTINAVKLMNNATLSESGFFGDKWSDELLKAFDINDLMKDKIDSATTITTFPSTHLGRQLETVAKLISTRADRNADKDFFYLEIGGFDTHSDVEENLSARFIEVNAALEAFKAELKHPDINMWNDVTTIQVSDFARTLNPNGGEGTDHAWGGNYMMFGGDVKGGQILGTYPDDLTDDGALGLGRGRLIPTTPWEACFKSVMSWIGVKCEQFCEVCVNCISFPESVFFDSSDLFTSLLNDEICDLSLCGDEADSNSPSMVLNISPSPTYSSKPSLSLQPSEKPSGIVWSKILSNRFEKGWGQFKSGGVDGKRNRRPHRKKAKGKGSLMIRDNSKMESSVMTNDLDVTNYFQIEISFLYIVHRFKTLESFVLKYKTPSNKRWTVLKSFVYGEDFDTLTKWYGGTATLDVSTMDTIQIAFQCKASSNRDKVYIDDVFIKGAQKL